jgi:hypothetical protein
MAEEPGTDPDDLAEFDLPIFQRLALVLQTLVFAFLQRATDLLLLVVRPSLLRPYLAIWWAERRRSPYRARRSFEVVRALRQTDQRFRELIYGEIPLLTAVLAFRRAGVRRGSRLVDLGAGRGRALIAARWLGAEVRGIELLEAHVTPVAPALARAGIALELGNMLEADLSSATHVFSDWVAFSSETKARLVTRLRTCASGTRVIVVRQPLEDPAFAPRSRRWMLFTWGVEPVWIYERTDGPAPNSAPVLNGES